MHLIRKVERQLNGTSTMKYIYKTATFNENREVICTQKIWGHDFLHHIWGAFVSRASLRILKRAGKFMAPTNHHEAPPMYI